ncbi:MAG: PRC-barrel domain-containing protein [Bacillota bacterium]|nr:PRC-barrel domain-containing protein [Bacillota bacterium]
MKKGRALIGLPVLSEKEGQPLGRVMDILYSDNEGQIKGILVETEGTSLPEMRFIQIANIKDISNEVVFIDNKNSLQAPQCLKADSGDTSYSTALLIGQHIYSELGKEQGMITDVVLDFDKGIVNGYQISNGFIADLVNGRNVIPVGSVITMGKDMIIVKEDIEKEGGR